MIRNTHKPAVSVCSHLVLLLTPKKKKKRRMTTCHNMVRGQGPSLSGSGNKLRDTSVVVTSPLTTLRFDAELPRAPNVSPCFPEHGNNKSACPVTRPVRAARTRAAEKIRTQSTSRASWERLLDSGTRTAERTSVFINAYS